MSALRDWLNSRTPAPPEELPLPVEDASEDLGATLTDAGTMALERALTGQGERGGAYDLLAADGLLTYACERAAGAADPEADLLWILERVGRRSG
jgi:hypothetical protein